MAEERAGQGWRTAFNETAGAYVSGQMPQLFKALQGTKENAIARGVSTGDLGTSYEGDVFSAFQRNLANVLGGMAMQGYENSRNRYVDMAAGKYTSAADAENSWANMWGNILGQGVQAAGSYYGGRK